jgi:electron transport complex protein RnfC
MKNPGIRLKKKGTPYGVKVPESKFTAQNQIEPAPLPEKAIIPLHQNIGAPCEAVVKKG